MDFKRAGQWGLAARCFERILQIVPNWEHGYGSFDLAECYEELGLIGDARVSYENAVSAGPEDRIFLGGLASFLLLHGGELDAFNQHVRLLMIEKKHNDENRIKSVMIAIESLAVRLGWSQELMRLKIREREDQRESKGSDTVFKSKLS